MDGDGINWSAFFVNLAPMLVLLLVMVGLMLALIRRGDRIRSVNAQNSERQIELSRKQLELSERSNQALVALLERMDQRIARLEDKR